MSQPDYLVWVVLPALVVWVATVADIATRRGLSRRGRLLWVVAITLVFPLTLLWYLLRPVGTPEPLRLDLAGPGDARVELARLVVARSRGALGTDAYERRLSALLPAGRSVDPAAADMGERSGSIGEEAGNVAMETERTRRER